MRNLLVRTNPGGRSCLAKDSILAGLVVGSGWSGGLVRSVIDQCGWLAGDFALVLASSTKIRPGISSSVAGRLLVAPPAQEGRLVLSRRESDGELPGVDTYFLGERGQT